MYDTCLWTRLSGSTCRSVSQAFHPLQYRKPRVDCGDLLKDAIPLSILIPVRTYPYIGCAQHNIVTFPIPTVTLHWSGCSALWCLCIRKLIVVCTQVHMWHLTLGITSLVPTFVLWFEFSIIHGSRRTTKKMYGRGGGGAENTHLVKNARWTRGGRRGGREFTLLILLSFSPYIR